MIYQPNTPRKESLYIPVGVKNRIELFSGYGIEERNKTIKVAIILLLVALVAYFISGDFIISFFIMTTGVTATIMLLTKSSINISTVDQIKFIYQYHREQQYFSYRYMNEFMNGKEE